MSSFKPLIFILLTLSLFATTFLLEDVLVMYQNNTLSKHPEAIETLKKEANNNNLDAAYLLATSYKEGKVGKVDMKLASYWYKKAALHGDGDAMLMLGWLYYKGVFGKSDLSEAKYWFQQAANSGIDEAVEMLEILN